MKRNTLILAALLIAATSAQASEPVVGDEAVKIIQDNVAVIHGLVMNSPTDEEMRSKTRERLEQFVDFPEFGKLCLGSHWDGLKKEQQEVYLVEFKLLLQNNYLRRFERGKEFTVTVNPEPRLNKDGDRVEVKTVVVTSADNVSADVDYRFHKTDAGWKVYDIVVDEVSMMRNYRKSFSKVMAKEGFDALLEKMRKKSASAGEKKDDYDL